MLPSLDASAYAQISLDDSPRQTPHLLFTHSVVTANYRCRRVRVDPKHQLILDVGCGSGYKSLVLAEANPGCRIVGIDISEETIQLASQRLQHHGFDQVEFHVLAIEDLPSLGLTFDYINCDEVLYLLPDPAGALRSLRSVLQPNGILRANLHNLYQRRSYFSAQTMFGLLGLMEEPAEAGTEWVLETMRSLKDSTRLKQATWHPIYEQQPEAVLSDYLLANDRGFTIPDLFALLRQTDLTFASMVNWWQWDFWTLFQDPDQLPAFWQENRTRFSQEQWLHFYELLHPIHRLMDFWSVLPDALPFQEGAIAPVDWTSEIWQKVIVHLHPQLQQDAIQTDLIEAYHQSKPFDFNSYLTGSRLPPTPIESRLAACLLPLWQGGQPFSALVDRYLQLFPLHPKTLEPTSVELATQLLKHCLQRLEAHCYILLIPHYA